MLCRVADSLYWMSRYFERAENTARLVDVNLLLEADDPSPEAAPARWEAILESIGDLELFRKLHGGTSSEAVAEFLTFNPKNPSSVYSCMGSARENARQVRDQISAEMWEICNRAYLFLRDQSRKGGEVGGTMGGPHDFYVQVKEYAHLFHGLLEATFTRQLGYDFIRAGRFLERADKTGRILDIKHFLPLPAKQREGGVTDTAHWVSILHACSALEAYQQTYVAEVDPRDVAEILVLSEDFPRSVRFCLEAVDTALHEISGSPRGTYRNRPEKLCGRLLNDLRFTGVDDILEAGMHETLQRLREGIEEIGVAFSEEYMFFPVVDPAAEATEGAGAEATEGAGAEEAAGTPVPAGEDGG